MRYHDYWRTYRPGAPKKVIGGIKAQSKRGAFAKNWWAQEYIRGFEWDASSSRIPRGKRYARSGQIATLEIDNQKISAEVQGTANSSYHCSLEVLPFQEELKKKILETFQKNPAYAIELLNGKLPEIFSKSVDIGEIDMHPRIKVKCSCYDSAIMCKHVLAVFYILAETFDQDPMFFFELQGITREMITEQDYAAPKPAKESTSKPVEFDLEHFWDDIPDSEIEDLKPHQLLSEAFLIRQLGPLPFWRSKKNFIREMEKIYKRQKTGVWNMFYSLQKDD